jgi:hypothetical protein
MTEWEAYMGEVWESWVNALGAMNPLNMVCGHLDMAGMTYANVITTKHQEMLSYIYYKN